MPEKAPAGQLPRSVLAIFDIFVSPSRARQTNDWLHWYAFVLAAFEDCTDQKLKAAKTDHCSYAIVLTL